MHYSLLRATFWNLSGYLYLLLASFISIPVLINGLGVAQFAQYSLVIASITLASALNLGLPQAVVRQLNLSTHTPQLSQTTWASSGILFLISGVLAGSLALSISLYLGLSSPIIYSIFGIVLLNSLATHLATLPHAHGHFGYYNAKTFIVGTANTLLAAYLAYLGQGINTILLSQLVCYILTLIPLVYFSLKYFPHPWRYRPTKPVLKSLLAFGYKNQLGGLVGVLQSQYGKYLLSASSPLSLSTYVLAQGLVQKLVGSVLNLASAFYPAATRSSNRTGLQHLYFKLQLGLFLLGVLAIILYDFVGLPFLTWWLRDPGLALALDAFLRVYRYYGLLLLLTPLASALIDGLGYPGYTAILGSLAFILELLVVLILLPDIGHLSFAYGGIISLSLMTPALLLLSGKILWSYGSAVPKRRASRS